MTKYSKDVKHVDYDQKVFNTVCLIFFKSKHRLKMSYDYG